VPRVGLEPTQKFLGFFVVLSDVRLPITPPRLEDSLANSLYFEARAGIEPAHVDFADRCVTSSPSGLFVLAPKVYLL
jgi:hypothetical protein